MTFILSKIGLTVNVTVQEGGNYHILQHVPSKIARNGESKKLAICKSLAGNKLCFWAHSHDSALQCLAEIQASWMQDIQDGLGLDNMLHSTNLGMVASQILKSIPFPPVRKWKHQIQSSARLDCKAVRRPNRL